MTAAKLYVLRPTDHSGVLATSPKSVAQLLTFEPRDTILLNNTTDTITSAVITASLSTYLNGQDAKYFAYLYTNNNVAKISGNDLKSLTDAAAYWIGIDKDTSTTVSLNANPKTNDPSPKETHFVLVVYPKTNADHLMFSKSK